jgi:hypothetical protein
MDLLIRVDMKDLKRLNSGHVRKVMVTNGEQDIFYIEEKFESGEGYGFHVAGDDSRYDFKNLYQLYNHLKKMV